MLLAGRHITSKLEDLDAILESVNVSGCFGKSSRQSALFKHLLEQTLAGRSSELSQYSIALDVLNRSDDFDPVTDSIVRVELHRLRANLEIYNNSQSDYHIKIPSGSFEVVVTPRRQAILSNWPFSGLATAAVLSISVGAFAFGLFMSKPFASPSEIMCSESLPNIILGYVGEPSETQDYVDSVLRSAMSQQTSFNILDSSASCGPQSAPVFNAQFTLVQQDLLFNVALDVIAAADNTVVESHHVKGKLTDRQVGSELYYNLVSAANDITLPSGIAARYARKGEWGSAEAQRNFSCLIAMYDSYAGELDSEFDNIHGCLEGAVKSGVATLDNYGALASSYFDQARNNRLSTAADPFAVAQAILEKQDESWIKSSELAIARLYFELDRPDFNAEQLDLALITTRARFSTNPQVLLFVASIYGYNLGRWEEAKALSDYVKQIYSIRDQSVFTVDAGYQIFSGELVSDAELCFKFYSKDSILTNIIVNACAVMAENRSWITLTEENLTRLGVGNITDRIAYVRSRVRDERFINQLESLLSETSSNIP